MGKTGEKEKRRSQGNVDPQAHSNNLFNLLVSCQGTSSSLEYVPVLIKRMCHTEVEEKQKRVLKFVVRIHNPYSAMPSK